ncbi:allophanate hydrolase [Humibacillus xanthopallidus]|uniref:Allophanate hydrolase n=1 Tax=Humibacillus xanthopallidus TaxID=412689 RepID=A0A543HVP6_9MICO|nr:allophanate hydrolase [Humibacillus xanthopallidus]TQM62380.1 allophanate hydrolase [Humibacillus xanthopallidus]
MKPVTFSPAPRTWDVSQALAGAGQLDNPAFISLVDSLVDDPGGADPGRAVGQDDSSDPVQASRAQPLRGMPFAVKDNIDVAGLPTTGACPTLTAPAERNAHVVDRLVAAGAIPIGKTNMDQFATGLVGTRSPYGACHCVDSDDHVSGGSSSGSAVAVASGVVPFALGTDTAGSGRVPAAFNGLVGYKPTRGLVSTRGVMPACPSLDCVSVFTTTVSLARAVHDVIAGFDPDDPWSRRRPSPPQAGIARVMGVVGVPDVPIDLDPRHRAAWEAALARFAGLVRLVPVDVSPMLEVATMLYDAPFVAERLAAFGHLLEPDGPHLDPTVRRIVLGAAGMEADRLFAAQHRLARLARDVAQATAGVDAVLLPTTPFHPTLSDVADDPVGTNSRLGTYTNMANLLDLSAVAIPAGRRSDGLPFGVQLVAPAFADAPLLDLAALLTGERASDVQVPVPPGRHLLAVCGAHLSGQPLNDVLTGAGARLHRRGRTAPGHRMVRIDGPLPRPGLLDDGTGPDEGIDVELWEVSDELLAQLALDVDPPLEIGLVRLWDGSRVAGFTADRTARHEPDISGAGSWRAHLADVSRGSADR